MTIDFLIIGGGPAGIAAAIQAARLGLSTTIIERDRLGGQALVAPWIENYPGFPHGISGHNLMHSFVEQLKKWSIPVIFEEATAIEKETNSFVVCTHGVTLSTKSILLAVGLNPKLLGIKNEIPYGDPDLIDHTGKNILIVGSGDSAFDLAWRFAERAQRVTVCMRNETPRALTQLVKKAMLRGVHIEANWSPTKISADIVISCIGKEIRHPLINNLKERFGPFELKAGEVTNIPDLFLAGDLCRGPDRHIAIAAGDGIAAAQAAYRFLNKATETRRHREHQKFNFSHRDTEAQRK